MIKIKTMILKRIRNTIFLLLLSTTVFSQTIGKADTLSREKASEVATKLLKNTNRDYLLFSIADKWFLLIKDNGDSYTEYYVNTADVNLNTHEYSAITIKKPNRILRKAFNRCLYHSGYISFNSQFFKDQKVKSEGNITYFFFKSHGRKIGECRLSMFINPNPINVEIYNYLRNKLLKHIDS